MLPGCPDGRTGRDTSADQRRDHAAPRADGQPGTSPDDLRSMIMEKSPGDSITLDIQRGQSTRTVNVTLGQQPAQPGG